MFTNSRKYGTIQPVKKMITTKDHVLYRLRTADGFVSGETLSKELKISRAAVNIAVKALKSEGYEIESVTQKGYRLICGEERLSVGEILSYCKPEKAGNITVYGSVGSTNEVLKELAAKEKATAGDCVIADCQTSGKGRRGRRFVSPKGKGLYFSILLDTKKLPAETLAELTAWGAVATAQAIKDVCGVSCGIKWVNDLVYGTKKLCGILTELSLEAETGRVQSVVMGIGINVNETAEDFPRDLADIATSIREICGEKISRAKLCAALIAHLDDMRRAFPAEKDRYLTAYRDRCAILGKTVTVEKPDGVFSGTAEAIDENFRLTVRWEDGTVETLNSGEVSVKGFYGVK